MTQFEIIIPTEWGVEKFEQLKGVFQSFCKEYAFALHPIDEFSNFEHWHLGGTLHSSRTFDDVFAQFSNFPEILSNSIERIKSHWKTYLCYILHQTKDAIAKGKSFPVDYGGNADFEKALGDYKKIGEFENLVNDIVNGKIREYDFYGNKTLVTEVIKSGRMTKVEQAFRAQERNALVESSTRTDERKQAWIYGLSGCGKTELAKETCRLSGYSDRDIYITSSGANPFDDYKGQPCVIVDDIDAETMSPKTMLKLADCFTGSAVRARYSNKVIQAKLVLFTSTISPRTWWNKLCDDKIDGNEYQLFRRLNLGVWHIEDNTFRITTFDGQGHPSGSAVAELPAEVWDKVRFGRASKKGMETLKSLFKVEAFDVSGNSVSVEVNPASGEFSGKVTPAPERLGSSAPACTDNGFVSMEEF